MIPFVDLKAQYAPISDDVKSAICKVVDNCQFVLGDEVQAFEKEFAAYCGAEISVGVNSGTSALHLALLAAGVGPGDEVITVPFTFVATVAAIVYAGAKPVFVDVNPVDYTIDVAKIEAAITDKTKAILPVHLYGQCADMDEINAIAAKHKLMVIEDAAQAHGAEYKGRRAGSMGDLGCFSFYPGKNLGAAGEGGSVTTSNPDLARAVRILRDWGAQEKYNHVLKGFNYRMEGIQGAVLRVKLRHLEGWTQGRIRAAGTYSELLNGFDLGLPATVGENRHVFHIYGVRVKNRAAMQASLLADGVQTGLHYPIPVHLLPAHQDLGYTRGNFPVSEQLADEMLSLPMFAELTDEQIKTVVSCVGKSVENA